jgi:hypothetical protein
MQARKWVANITYICGSLCKIVDIAPSMPLHFPRELEAVNQCVKFRTVNENVSMTKCTDTTLSHDNMLTTVQMQSKLQITNTCDKLKSMKAFLKLQEQARIEASVLPLLMHSLCRLSEHTVSP